MATDIPRTKAHALSAILDRAAAAKHFKAALLLTAVAVGAGI